MPSNSDVFIIGASTRAAAFSAVRAGLRPHCLDYYADADLTALCPATRFDPLQDNEELERMATSLGRLAWLYTGPLENRPDLVGRLSRTSRLLGNSPETLRRVRDPSNVAGVLKRHGTAAPMVRRTTDGRPTTGRWLVKPLASAGGLSISLLDDAPDVADELSYYQEFINGPTLSALFVAARGEARLLGISRQFQGAPGAPFLYRESVGPWPVADATSARLDRLGDLLAAEFALIGLFGVDFILHQDVPWPIEVNPRYTASVEVLELAARRALLTDHLAACANQTLPDDLRSPSASVVGKRVLYASRKLLFPTVSIPRLSHDVFNVPSIADVPPPGTTINPGEPIMTVLARGADPRDCRAKLDQLEREWLGRLERVVVEG